MQTQISTKYRLVALLMASVLPGTHRLYVGKIKSGLCMLVVLWFLPLTCLMLNSNAAPSIFLLLLILCCLMGVLIWILIDLSAISVGTFKDSNGLLLLRRKNCGISEKSNITAILLCTFLGFLGLHRFYLGRSKSGFIILFSSLFMIFIILFSPLFMKIVSMYFFNNFIPSNPITIPKTVYFYITIIAMAYFLICMMWVYIIDLFALLGGVFTDINNKLPKDSSSSTST